MKSLRTLVREDQRIEEDKENATLRLMEHRWNVVHVHGYPVREFAKELGRNQGTIQHYLKGWEMWQEQEGDAARAGSRSPVDILELATMGAERQEAAKAVADAKGIGVKNVRNRHRADLKKVEGAMRTQKQRIAEAHPDERKNLTDPVEHGRNVARLSEKRAQHQKAARQERRDKAGTTFSSIEGQLLKAHTALSVAIEFATKGTINAEYVEYTQDYIQKVRGLLDLLEMAVSGKTAVDWDTEMQKLTMEGN